MKKSDFVPTQQEELATWSDRMAKKAKVVASQLGLPEEDVTQLAECSANINVAVKDTMVAKGTANSVVAQKRLVIETNVKIIRRIAQSIKANKNYTEAIGEALGIIGSDENVNRDEIKPELTAHVSTDHVRLSFSKKGIDGVHIFSRRKEDATWQLLGTDYFSPYTDHRPLAVAGTPETREYMCRGIIHDEEVGVNSDIVSVVFGG